VADFLDSKVKEIEERLRELRPLIDEYQRLEAAAAALGGVDPNVPVTGGRGPRNPGPRRRGTGRVGRPPGSGRVGRPPGSGRGRPGRPRAGNTRAAEAAELVRARPGATIPELAESMGIKPNYLYRILPSLEQDGKVKRQGKGWHPA
jgi:hypothetical protein